jgi:hypothetical protein
MGLADRPAQVGGPSAIHPVGSKVCSLRTGPVHLYCGPSRPWGRTSVVLTREGCSLHSPCNVVQTVRPGTTDRPQVPNWFGQGLCVFGHLYYELSRA